jgi:hypothetical protein
MTICPKCKQAYSTYHKCFYKEERINDLEKAFSNRWRMKNQKSKAYQRAVRAHLRQIQELYRSQI